MVQHASVQQKVPLWRRGTSAFPERSVKLLLKPLMHALNEDTSARSPDDVKASRITWLAAKLTVLSAVVPGAAPHPVVVC